MENGERGVSRQEGSPSPFLWARARGVGGCGGALSTFSF
jgi:hypothetical protein